MAGKSMPYATTLTTSGGTVSSNVSGFPQIVNPGGIIYQVFVRSTFTDTIFDFHITSPAGNIIYQKKNITQVLNDNSIRLPVQGTYTLTVTIVESSLADETFQVELGFKEERV